MTGAFAQNLPQIPLPPLPLSLTRDAEVAGAAAACPRRRAPPWSDRRTQPPPPSSALHLRRVWRARMHKTRRNLRRRVRARRRRYGDANGAAPPLPCTLHPRASRTPTRASHLPRMRRRRGRRRGRSSAIAGVVMTPAWVPDVSAFSFPLQKKRNKSY